MKRMTGYLCLALAGLCGAVAISSNAPATAGYAPRTSAVDGEVVPVEESMHEFMEYVFQPTYLRLKQSMAAAPAGYAVQPAEAPYTIWNVLGLVSCALLLAVSLMMMTDLMRNMWAFNSDRVISTSLMDGILSAFGMR